MSVKSPLWLSGGILLVASLATVVSVATKIQAQSSVSAHLTMGNPSEATSSDANNYLMVKPQYALSYNNGRCITNWVSWQLNSSWLGSAPRQDDFRSDPALPPNFCKANTSDYTYSGFDRGHITPSADRTDTVANNSATFLMSNIVPQAPDNNQGYWARLEDYERTLVSQGKELYIIAGAYGTGGSGSNGAKNTIYNGKITVPDRLYKIIVVVDPGSGVSGVNSSNRVIAINTPNDQGNRTANWGSYRTTVDAIEAATGYDFLSQVSSSIQAEIESQVDTGPTQ